MPPLPQSNADLRLIDLDRAATTPLDAAVDAAMRAVPASMHGNPSSRHAVGVAARHALEEARASLARAVDTHLEGVVFTSGGTEANNLGVLGLARAQRRHGRHVLVGASEHSSVAGPAAALTREGFEIEHIALEPDGTVDVSRFEAQVREDTVLVAQMLVNNLIGSIAPVTRMARLARARSAHVRVHVDAIQALGKLPFSFAELGADACSLSAHKLHGPKGVGALLLSAGARVEPLTYGGGQEAGLRPGTENVAGVVGLATAVQCALATRVEDERRLESVRDILRAAVDAIPGARLLEPADPRARVPSILAVLLPGPPAEVWLHHLEHAGVLTSVGSACQSRAKTVPPGLLALGLVPDQARRVLRLSTSRTTSLADAREGAERIVATASRLKGLGLIRAERAGARA